MMTAEQMIAAQKANLETLFGLTEKPLQAWKKWLSSTWRLPKLLCLTTKSMHTPS